MADIRAYLAPRTLAQVLRAYSEIWTENNRNPEQYAATPLMTVYLRGGNSIGGEVVHIDLVAERLTLYDEATGNVAFLGFGQIEGFILHQIHLCERFAMMLQEVY